MGRLFCVSAGFFSSVEIPEKKNNPPGMFVFTKIQQNSQYYVGTCDELPIGV